MAEKAEAIAGDAEKRVMVLAFDDSEHSIYALHWTLRHFFAGAHGGGPLTDVYKLLILHAVAGPSPAIGLGGPGLKKREKYSVRTSARVAAVLPKVESELWKISEHVIEKAREICVSNSVLDVEYVATQGDANHVICDAVEKFQADVLVVGSHGYGAVKRAVLGSVSDYCAHHAHCTVMIVKKPKDKH